MGSAVTLQPSSVGVSVEVCSSGMGILPKMQCRSRFRSLSGPAPFADRPYRFWR